jgi:hypothetical protein
MPALTPQRTIHTKQFIRSGQAQVRRVQNVVLPGSASTIECSNQRLSASPGRQLASKQRILDPDD